MSYYHNKRLLLTILCWLLLWRRSWAWACPEPG